MKIKKRIGWLKWIGLIGFLVLAGRLFDIQIWSQTHFGKNNVDLVQRSIQQRIERISLSDGRGVIYDRKGIPLANEEKNVLLLFPLALEQKESIEQVATTLKLKDGEKTLLKYQLETIKKPTVFKTTSIYQLSDEQYTAMKGAEIPGVVAVKMQVKDQESLAQHVIGFAKQSKDNSDQYVYLSGINAAFNEYLRNGNEEFLTFEQGIKGIRLNTAIQSTATMKPTYSVVTTIDATLQQEMERIIDRAQMKNGVAILVDVDTNEVLAMVSRPLATIEQPLEEEGINKALKVEKVGSVFKTIVLTAALEEGIVSFNETFDCNKDYLTGDALPVHKQQGILSVESSFARSCNRTFAELGTRIIQKNPNAFDEITQRLGADGAVGWKGSLLNGEIGKHFLNEEKGQVFGFEKEKLLKVPRAIRTTSIGQQNVQLTPLEVVNMMSTIARGGEKYEVKLVKEIRSNQSGKTFVMPAHKMGGEKVKPETIQKVQQALRAVVTSGTGISYQNLPYAVAGKSGTAQTGKEKYFWHGEIKKDLKEPTENKWFAGYFPYEKPKYALVVANLGVSAKDYSGRVVFQKLVQEIYDYNHPK